MSHTRIPIPLTQVLVNFTGHPAHRVDASVFRVDPTFTPLQRDALAAVALLALLPDPVGLCPWPGAPLVDPEDLVRGWPFDGARPSAPEVAAALRPIARRAVDAGTDWFELDPALIVAGARQRRLRLDFLHLQAVLGGRRAA